MPKSAVLPAVTAEPAGRSATFVPARAGRSRGLGGRGCRDQAARAGREDRLRPPRARAGAWPATRWPWRNGGAVPQIGGESYRGH